MGMAFPIRAASPGDILEAEEELDPDVARAGGGGKASSPSTFSCVAFSPPPSESELKLIAFMRAARPGEIFPEAAGAAAAAVPFFSLPPPPEAEEEAEEEVVSFKPSIRAASPAETRGESPALTGEFDDFCSVLMAGTFGGWEDGKGSEINQGMCSEQLPGPLAQLMSTG